MKIGIDAHALEGRRTGVGRYLINILKMACQTPAIREKFIFCLYFKKEIPRDSFLDDPIFVKRVLNLPGGKSSFFIYFLFLLPWALFRDKVDLAFFPSYMMPLTYFGPSVMAIHDLAYEVHPELFPWRYRLPYKIFSRYGAHRAKKILTISNFSKNEIVKYYQIKPAKISVTSLGVDEIFKVVDDQTALRQIKEKYRIKNKFIFYVGQIFNRRYVAESLRAFDKIAGQFPNCQFLVVGKNRTNPFIDIERIAEQINQRLKREVILRQDYVSAEDLVLLYNAAQLSIYLSDYEGFGLPPLEAMACGTPVITTNLTALKETVGQSAVLVKNPQDVNEIAQAFFRVLANEDLQQKFIQKGLDRVKHFSWQRCAEKTFEIFLSLK